MKISGSFNKFNSAQIRLRAIKPDNPTPISELYWVTPEGNVGEVQLQEPFEYTFVADHTNPQPQPQARTMARMFSIAAAPAPLITYEQIDGDTFPETLSLASNGVLNGYFTTITGGAPVWVTKSGNLATVSRYETLDTTVKANPTTGRTVTNYSVVGNAMLPAGVYLGATTGRITGPADLYVGDDNLMLESATPIPTWVTPTDLGTFSTDGSTSVVNLTMVATANRGNAIVNYALVGGQDTFPNGLRLFSNSGLLAGNIERSIADSLEVTDSMQPAPVWNTASNLGTYLTVGSRALVNVAFSATPQRGNAITTYTLVANTGTMPFGVSLASNVGVLSGNVVGDLAEAVVFESTPDWSTAAGSLGSASNGAAVSVPVTFVSASTASLMVANGALPFGTRLTSTGSGSATITGTLDANYASPGAPLSAPMVFNFTLRATDAFGEHSDRSFSYQINAN